MQDIYKSDTFRLLKERPTFVEGISGLIDIRANLASKFNTDESEALADFKSLESDWRAVGKDMYHALKEYGDTKHTKRQPA